MNEYEKHVPEKERAETEESIEFIAKRIRHQVLMAYLQGRLDQIEDDRKRLLEQEAWLTRREEKMLAEEQVDDGAREDRIAMEDADRVRRERGIDMGRRGS